MEVAVVANTTVLVTVVVEEKVVVESAQVIRPKSRATIVASTVGNLIEMLSSSDKKLVERLGHFSDAEEQSMMCGRQMTRLLVFVVALKLAKAIERRRNDRRSRLTRLSDCHKLGR